MNLAVLEVLKYSLLFKFFFINYLNPYWKYLLWATSFKVSIWLSSVSSFIAVTAIYDVYFYQMRAIQPLWMFCTHGLCIKIRMDVEMLCIVWSHIDSRRILRGSSGLSTHLMKQVFPSQMPFPRFVWDIFTFCTLCNRYMAGFQVNEEWWHI